MLRRRCEGAIVQCLVDAMRIILGLWYSVVEKGVVSCEILKRTLLLDSAARHRPPPFGIKRRASGAHLLHQITSNFAALHPTGTDGKTDE